MYDPNFPIEQVRRPSQGDHLDSVRMDHQPLLLDLVASQNGRAGTPALTNGGGRDAPEPGSETSVGDSVAHAGQTSFNRSVSARNDREWEPIIDMVAAPVDTVSDGSKGETLASPGKVQSNRCQRESQHQDQAAQSEAGGATDDLTIAAHHQQPQFSCLSEGAEPRAGAATGAEIIPGTLREEALPDAASLRVRHARRVHGATSLFSDTSLLHAAVICATPGLTRCYQLRIRASAMRMIEGDASPRHCCMQQ